MHGPTRRTWMGLAAGSVAAAATGAAGSAEAASPAIPKSQSLDGLAKAKGLLGFGSCIGDTSSTSVSGSFQDAGVRAIHVRECGIVVPSNALKWNVIRPNPQDFNFYEGDAIVKWGEANAMKVRGHNLLWLRPDRNPDWIAKYDFGTRPATEAERMLREHITTVCRRYGDRIFTWDVVNEAIDPATGELRDMAFTKHLGAAVMDIAFDAAHQAVPNCVLTYNDFMGWTDTSARHRDGVLKLLSRMKSSGLPVHTLGVQAHIGAGLIGNVQGNMDFNAREQDQYKIFLDAAAGMGHRLAITEFDVSEDGTPQDIFARDKIMADLTRRYMDFMLRYPQLDHVMTWGMVDHHSWLQSRGPRPDGMLKRPAPYDPNYQPKLMREAFADAFRSMPRRG